MKNPQNETKGVKTLLGDPKKALLKLALPVIAGNLIQTIYNLVDAIWVSGIGANALAAVGYFFPFFFISIGLAMGLGIGGGSAISRRIGARDQAGAGMVASHTLLLTFLIGISFCSLIFLAVVPIFSNMGVGDALDMTISYARIMSLGAFFVFFANVGAAILRAEGDTKRAMWAIAFGTVLNIVLDPIFIYGFNLGVAGAAWASVFSLILSTGVILYWLFLKKDTYVPIEFRHFKWNKAVLSEIFKVGIPSSVQNLSMAASMFILNMIVNHVGSSDGVAIFTTGWRIFMLGSMPIFGIAAAVNAICGAAYGAKDMKKLNIAYMHAIKISIFIEICAALFIFLFAPFIVKAFTFSQGSEHIAPGLIVFLRVMVVTLWALALGPVSSSMFQAIAKGSTALVLTILRTFVLTFPLIWLFSYFFQLHIVGIWWGIACANALGSMIAFTMGKLEIRRLIAASSQSS